MEYRLENDGTVIVDFPIAQTPTNLSYKVSGANLVLSWPPNYQTWVLQSNSIGLDSPANWHSLSNTAALTNFSIPINPAGSNVFYRLRSPQGITAP